MRRSLALGTRSQNLNLLSDSTRRLLDIVQLSIEGV